jgi:tetratricopeptide (TPR) repeat protein
VLIHYFLRKKRIGIKLPSLPILLLFLVSACIGCHSQSLPEAGNSYGKIATKPGESSPLEAYQQYLAAQYYLFTGDLQNAIDAYEEAAKLDPNSVNLETELAALLIRKGDITEALAHLEKAISLDPNYLEAHQLLAGLHTGMNQLKEATSQYEKIISLDPNNQEAVVFLATLYAQQGNCGKSVSLLKNLLKKNPNHFIAHFYLGKCYTEQGQLTEARKEFQTSLHLQPDFLPAMLEMGSVYELENQFSRAQTWYRRVLQQDPTNLRALASMGRIFLITKHYAEAVKTFNEIKRLGKSEPDTPLKIGLLYFEQKYYDEAIREFREYLISQKSGADQARFFLAAALEEKGDTVAALREYEQIGRRTESYIPARLRMAHILARQRNFREGVKIIQDALLLHPENGDLYLTLAAFYEEEQEYTKAIETLNQASKSGVNPAEVYFRLAVVYDKKKEPEESRRYISKVLELEPNNPDALNFLGYMYISQGKDLGEAERLIQSALALKPEAGYIIDSLGWVYYKKALYDQAIVYLERAHKKMPQDATIAEHLADAYVKKFRLRDALRLYKKALTLDNANIPGLNKKIKFTEELLQGTHL